MEWVEIIKPEIMFNPGLCVTVDESPPAVERVRPQKRQRGFRQVGWAACLPTRTQKWTDEVGKQKTFAHPSPAYPSVSESPPAGKPACSKIGQRGFTLIELIVIIVVIAVLAVVALPRMIDFTTFGEVGFHDSLKASIQYARKLAVGSRRYVCVNVAANRVAILQDPRAPESAPPVNCTDVVNLPAASNVTGCATNEVCAPTGVTLSGGASFIYSPLGQPVDASRTVLGSVASFTVSGGQPVITIQANTGLVD